MSNKKNNYPVVSIPDHDPLNEAYYEDKSGNRYLVSRLVGEAKELVPFDIPIAALDLSAWIWQEQTIFEQARNVKQVMDVDLSYPIILDWNGAVADGRHRIIKAIVEGRQTISAVRLKYTLRPCQVAEGATQ